MLISMDLWVYFFIHRLTEALRLKNVSKCNVRNDGMTLMCLLIVAVYVGVYTWYTPCSR